MYLNIPSGMSVHVLKLPVNQFWLTYWRGLYQNGVYIELLLDFFSLRQTWSRNLQKMYSGKMLASNTLVAAFVLCLFISFTDIIQGSEDQPNRVNEGMFVIMKDWFTFGDLQCSLFLKETDGDTPFVCCVRRGFPKFQLFFFSGSEPLSTDLCFRCLEAV